MTLEDIVTVEQLAYRVGYLESGLRRLAEREPDAARLWDEYLADVGGSMIEAGAA